jgi:hypothetical protein
MDLGANFHKELKNGTRTWSISVYNVYNRENPFVIMWDTEGGNYELNPVTGEYVQVNERRTILKQVSIMQLIPSISYSFKF